MTRPGFFISRLVITGSQVEAAELTFERGTNVITGPSNTGKSYIVECIEFVLGAKTPPSADIEEARGYDLAYVELTSYDDAVVTLQRSLAGGHVNLYRAAYASILSVEPTILSVATQAKSRETLSHFLLGLFGVEGAEIRINASGEKTNLTFRMISHFFLVDESRIIAKASPIRLQSGFAHTSSARAFNFLITGYDDQAIISTQKPEERKAAMIGKREAFDELIAELEEKLKDRSLDNARSKAAELDASINATIEHLQSNASSIQEIQTTRQATFSLVQASTARLETIAELLTRFAILKEHYSSDLKRLEFLQETDHYFEQLSAIRCPLCGTSLEAHAARKMCVDATSSVPDMQTACAAEAAKINTLLRDLERTIGGLEQERKDVVAASQEHRDALGRLEKSLSDELRPALVAAKNDLDRLSFEKQEAQSIEVSFQTLEHYRRLRSDLDSQGDEGSQEFEGISAVAGRQLANTIQKLLREWRFIGEEGIVELKESAMDLAIDGKPRQSNGKGVRAFLHTVFTLGLMHYCRREGLPHPGFTILDSPLTSYREGKTNEAEDETSLEIQSAFWDSLAGWTKEEQTIIIENKEPTDSARTKMNYIHFVGKESSELSRKGLFPTDTSIQVYRNAEMHK
jgi:hypothetical protein